MYHKGEKVVYGHFVLHIAHVSLCNGTISRDGKQGSDYRFSNLP
jgi:hypothetical protein